MVGNVRVGFIGLGNQGAPMARRIIDAGFETVLWARRPAALEAFEGEAEIVSTPSAVGAAADVVGICVFDDAAVEEVVLGSRGVLAGMAAGGVIVIHSTVSPELCVALADAAEERSVHIVDGPVAGGGSGARAGKLLILVGGDEGSVEICRPVFECFADRIRHVGVVGSGQRAKLINNLLLMAQFDLAADACALAEAWGIAPSRLGEVLRRSTGDSLSLQALARLDGRLESIATTRGAAMRKDMELAAAAVDRSGVSIDSLLGAADGALTRMGLPRREIHG
jgi:3-hydroxyisobutyrate dehydrogenase